VGDKVAQLCSWWIPHPDHTCIISTSQIYQKRHSTLMISSVESLNDESLAP